MLDLTAIRHYYELKWFDGAVLHINTPTQDLLIRMKNLDKAKDTDEQLNGIMAIVKEILNNNKEQRVFTDEDMEQIDIAIASIIIEDYTNDVLALVGE